jgi:DNA helicase-2/ATP-dependent DNA helicase PcrA
VGNNMEYFDYLKNFNGMELSSQQMEAASFDKGNALVLSTAGSGKTTVIIARAGRLLYENKCSKKILTITFSKMAANDMKERFACIGRNRDYEAKTEFSTIHAFSYKIVRDFYRRKGINFGFLTNNYQVLSEILRNYYSKSYFSYISEEEIENLSSSIGYVNNMMIAPEEYKDHGIVTRGFDTLYNDYKMYKSQNKLIDFDDMLILSYKILSGSANYRQQLSNTFEYVQIDEMQDTSRIQHEIIKLITHDNLFMVGDDDQAIYSFRGSNPDFMLKFKDIYNDGKIFYLDNNYRSDKYIVEGVRNFIEINKSRYKKAIKTDNKKQNEINIIKVKTRADQAKLITEALKVAENKTVGILFRYNMSAMIPANSFYENNIDFYIKEDKTKFFSNAVLYDILAFLNLAVDPKDRDAFARIYYKSYTYFTKGMCKMVQDSREDRSVFDILSGYMHFDYKVYEKIKQFKIDINYLNMLKPYNAIRFIKFNLEYINYLERMQEEGRYSMSNSLHILEILEGIGSYCSDIKEFLKKLNNLRDVIKRASENKGANITLTSIHSAKGLEYDYVYMIDNLEELNIDKNISGDEYEKILEEERRVFYVGMTRARDKLNIVIPGEPSLFVNELIEANKK